MTGLLRARLHAAKTLIDAEIAEGRPKDGVSRAQADAFVQAVEDIGHEFTKKQNEALFQEVVECPWAAADLKRVLDVMSKMVKKKRRHGVVKHPMILHMYTQKEWDEWKAGKSEDWRNDQQRQPKGRQRQQKKQGN